MKHTRTSAGPITYDLEQVLQREHAVISKRRGTGVNKLSCGLLGPSPGVSKRSVGKEESVYDTVGLALSGGGIRSAAFCLGALQALEVEGVLKRLDYVSTVSGGGYAGACWTAHAHHARSDALPFSSELKTDEPPGLRHIRDHANYLIPHGVMDILISAAVYLRGIAANILIVLPLLLFAAALTIWLYPDKASLDEATKGSVLPFTTTIVLVLGVFLLVWSLYESWGEKGEEPTSGRVRFFFSVAIVILGAIALYELQPWVLAWILAETSQETPERSTSIMPAVVAFFTAFAALVGLLGNKLTWIVNQVTDSATFRTHAKAITGKLLLYGAAMVLPLILWVVYLQLSLWGIAKTANAFWPDGYQAPQWMKTFASATFVGDGSLAEKLLGWLDGSQKVASWYHGVAAEYPVAVVYFIFFLILSLASIWLKPNANSLHRLYRDRLRATFLFRPGKDASEDVLVHPVAGLKLSQLAKQPVSPYPLINAAINLQGSKHTNQRGRDADFFLFSPCYVGSRSTGYVPTKLMEEEVKGLDLGTAMAISGAAAASNMGANLKRWTVTLALLNVRLGYWLPNPKYVGENRARTLSILRSSNWYLLSEALSLLSEDLPFVYVTDGGHVDNTGLYSLLQRRCAVIIAVDAESDRAVGFTSFLRAERHARIDLGTRIELPWEPIRDAAAEVNRATTENRSASGQHTCRGPHCAIGRIYYPGGQGLLIYIKSSLTGDESDYVLDYKRRHPRFPHETTGDQFFSEEQFEVYRNLGFHAVQGLFDQDQDKVAMAEDGFDLRGIFRKSLMDMKSAARLVAKESNSRSANPQTSSLDPVE